MGKSLAALLANKHKKESKLRDKSVKPTIRTLSFVHPRGPLVQWAFSHFKLSLVTMAHLRKRPSAKMKRPAAAAAVVEPSTEPPRTLSSIDSRITNTDAPTERYRFNNECKCLEHFLWLLCLCLSLGRRHVRKLDTPYPFPRVPADLGIPGSQKKEWNHKVQLVFWILRQIHHPFQQVNRDSNSVKSSCFSCNLSHIPYFLSWKCLLLFLSWGPGPKWFCGGVGISLGMSFARSGCRRSRRSCQCFQVSSVLGRHGTASTMQPWSFGGWPLVSSSLVRQHG